MPNKITAIKLQAMKKIALFSGLALVLGLVSCKHKSDEIPIPPAFGSGNTFNAEYTDLINATSGTLPGDLPTNWSQGDAAYLYVDPSSAGNGSNLTSIQNEISICLATVSEDKGTQTAFRAMTGFWINPAVNTARTFYAAYPVKSGDTGASSTSFANNDGTCSFDLAREQTQSNRNDVGGLSKYTLMWGDPIPDGQGVADNLSFTFHHLCAVLGFSVANLPSSVKVKSIEIREVDPATNQPLTATGNALCFMTKMALNRQTTGEDYRFGTVTAGYVNSMKVTLDTEATGDFTARLAVIPHDFMTSDGTTAVNGAKGPDATRNFAVVVFVTRNGEDDTYTFDYHGINTCWKPGYYYAMPLNFRDKWSESEIIAGPPVSPQLQVNYPAWSNPAGLTPTAWSAGDALYFYVDPNSTTGNGTNIATTQTQNFALYTLASGATFSNTAFTVGSNAKDTRTFYAASPAKGSGITTGVDNASFANSNGTCTFNLDQVQTQNGASDPAGLKKYLLLWGDPKPDGDGVLPNMNYTLRHLCAVLGFNIQNLPANVSVTGVEVREVNPISNKPLTVTGNALCFMTKMELSRKSTGGNWQFGNVTTGYVNSVSVNMASALSTNFTARLAVIPHDFMTDGTSAVNAAKGSGATRNLAVLAHVIKDGKVDSYTFAMPDASSYWEPGKYYESNLDFENGAKLPDSELAPPVDVDDVNHIMDVSDMVGLKWIATETNKGSNSQYDGFTGWTVRLTADIDLGGAPWTPIGDSTVMATPFTGIFDGDNHTISNLVLIKDKTGQGLFGYAGRVDRPQTIIKNVKIMATATILESGPNTSGSGAYGALLGCGYNVKISGCSLTGAGKDAATIMYHNVAHTGSLVGELNNSTIEDCKVINVRDNNGAAFPNQQSLLLGGATTANNNSGGGGSPGRVYVTNCSVESSSFTSTGSNNGTGGIVGRVDGVPVTISGCKLINTAIATTSNNNGGNGNGGLVGAITANNTAGSLITGCIVDSYCTIQTGVGESGGICGSFMSASAIINCSNGAPIKQVNNGTASSAGGICGMNSNASGLIMGCVNTASIEAGPNPTTNNGGVAGGICGTNNGMVVACKQAAGTLTVYANNAGSREVGGICARNTATGTVVACCVTDVTFTFMGSSASYIRNIIAPGTVDASCYYSSTALGAAKPNGTAFDAGWPDATMPGWGAAPTNWANYAPADSAWATWVSPWSSLGASPAPYPKLSIEP